MKTKPRLICDLCDREINEHYGVRTVKHSWYSWGLTRTEHEIEHICPECWDWVRQKREEETA